MEWKKTDVLIVGTGVAGLFCALNLPPEKSVLMISKSSVEESDSFLAQGGICVLRGPDDYHSYFEDTMRAGHYENRTETVDIMIRNSQEIIRNLIDYGVAFEQNGQEFVFTKEGGHSKPRILFHQDITGEEITGKLLAQVKKLAHVTMMEQVTMIDIVCSDQRCRGIIGRRQDGNLLGIQTGETVLACGGVGGLYEHSTNYDHLTGDGLAIAMKHQVEMENIDYIQTHPTTLYSLKKGRRFLISESVRGEGAVLYNAKGNRFVDELLPRDRLTKAIHHQMKQDDKPHVWLSMERIPPQEIKSHFPNIYRHCLKEGYDILHEWIPVVPAQHYLMGGIKVDGFSKTSLPGLYAVGETSCNGVHGANRLASNSLLESLVFAKRAAKDITANGKNQIVKSKIWLDIHDSQYADYERLKRTYKKIVKDEIERIKRIHDQSNYNEIKCGQTDLAGIAGGYYQ